MVCEWKTKINRDCNTVSLRVASGKALLLKYISKPLGEQVDYFGPLLYWECPVVCSQKNEYLIQVWFFSFLSTKPQTASPPKKGHCLLFLIYTHVNLRRACNKELTLLQLWEDGGRRAVYLATCKGLESEYQPPHS